MLILEDQAAKRKITAEQFGKSLSGDSVKEATEALLYGISDFFEDQKKRTAFTDLIEAMREEADRNVDYMIEKAPMIRQAIAKAGETYRKELDKNLTEQLGTTETAAEPTTKKLSGKSKDSGNSSGNTPESSASTPTP